MKTELTKSEREQIKTTKNEWIKQFKDLPELNKDKATKMINWLYNLCGYEKPDVYFVDSPMACQNKANELNKTENKFYDFCTYGDISDYNWVAYYDYYNKIGIKYSSEVQKKFDNYKELMKCGIYTMIQFDKACIVSSNPVFMNFDEKKRLHSVNGNAIEWSDGYGKKFIHGVKFDDREYDKFIVNEPKGSDVIRLENTEQKSALFQLYGFDKFFNDLQNMKVIDEGVEKQRGTDYSINYKLFDFNIGGNVVQRAVRVEWYEKGELRTSTLGVPNSISDYKTAVASTFGKTKEEYWNGCFKIRQGDVLIEYPDKNGGLSYES